MGKYITIIGYDEERAKNDVDNILIPDWFMDRQLKSEDHSTSDLFPDESKMSDAYIHAESREIKVMTVLFDYMGTDQDIDPYIYICRKTGYAKSLIREVIEEYARLGYVIIGN